MTIQPTLFPVVNEEVANRDPKYYIFDWDDNILHMPTKIRMEHKKEDGTWENVELSTASFAMVRTDVEHYRPPQEGGWDAAFRNFGDTINPNGFIDDTIAALERVKAGEKPGPSFNTLKKTLRDGRLFAIVTARGHSAENIQKAVRLFIARALTFDERQEMMANLRGYRKFFDHVTEFDSDEVELTRYLNACRYCAVTNPVFKERMLKDPIYQSKLATAPTASKSELAKEFAIRDFVEHIYHMLRRRGSLAKFVSIGFSDDDRGNVKSVSRYIHDELSKQFDGIKFVVYDTSDRSLPKGRKVCISGQLNLPGF